MEDSTVEESEVNDLDSYQDNSHIQHENSSHFSLTQVPKKIKNVVHKVLKYYIFWKFSLFYWFIILPDIFFVYDIC